MPGATTEDATNSGDLNPCKAFYLEFTWPRFAYSPMSTDIHISRGAGTIFFLGGKNVDMPSDCQNLGGGGAQAYPFH